MKKIVLMRHGKSSWEYNVSDQERPLKSRGKRDAELVANEFVKANKVPKNIYSSPAKRALSTCKIFTKTTKIDAKKIQIKADLYDFGGASVMNFIQNLPDDINEVMLFGHNHAFTNITNRYGHDYISNLPTSGLVVIEFDTNSWTTLKKGKTKQIIIPKALR